MLAVSLDSMSGEIHASAIQLAAIDGESATDAIRSEVSTRMSQGNAETGGRSSAWGFDGARNWFRFRGERNSFDSIGERDGLFGVRGATGSISGFAMGRDWTPSQHWLFGVGGSFATGRMGLNGSRDSTTFSAPRGIAYVGYAGQAGPSMVASASHGPPTRRPALCSSARLRRPAARFSTAWTDGREPDRRALRRNVERNANRQAVWIVEGSTHRRPAPGPIRVERMDRRRAPMHSRCPRRRDRSIRFRLTWACESPGRWVRCGRIWEASCVAS